MKLQLRVRCGKCPQKVGEVYELEDGRKHYRPIWPGHTDRQDLLSTPAFWCADHGWVDPEEVDKALAEGKATLRAHMGPRRPQSG